MAGTATTEWPLGGVVAVTKLRVPDRRPALVPRDALVALLTAGRHARLTLLTGPPGAGKTTLLTQWHAAEAEERVFAWLSLDPEDADPVRFWGCVIAALRTAHPGFGAEAAGALRAGRAALTDAVVPLVVNEAAGLDRPTVLVLDDLHVLDDADEVHRSLGFLLDHLPPSLHLAIATRRDPRLPVARLRARSQLLEIRARDLRFSDVEASALLQRGFGLDLAEGDVTRLQARTEGWAAGLQLAGLSLGRQGADFESFMAAFGGEHADVLAYLGAEMLDGEAPEVREFLLDTAILERLSAPLCDAVRGRGGTAEQLEALERRNALIVPLDARRRWWRYHQLLAELLRHELVRSRSPEEIAALHRRAASWFAEHGSPSDAIRHALGAGDVDVGGALVAEHWEAAFNRGELATVSAWLDRLPDEALVRDPRLWLARLWTAMDRGRLVDVERHLLDAQASAAPEARSWGVLLHALHAFKKGDLAGAAAGVARAEESGSDDPFWRTVATLVHGFTAYWGARTGEAYRSFATAHELAEEHGNRLGAAYALGYLALIAAEAGDREGAEGRLARIEALRAEDAAVGEHFLFFVAALVRGRLLEQTGAYEAAAAALERAVVLSRRGAGRLEMAEPLLELALVQRTRRRRPEAVGLVHEARRVLEPCPDPGRLTRRLTAVAREVLGASAEAEEAAPREALSESELAVLRLLPTGLSQREIGAELFVSVNTVKTHCRNIYAKLRTGSRDQAVGRARELGLLR